MVRSSSTYQLFEKKTGDTMSKDQSEAESIDTTALLKQLNSNSNHATNSNDPTHGVLIIPTNNLSCSIHYDN
jgi:hypothetical protein